MVKQKLTLNIDKEIIIQAKKQQINLSSFLEIRLVDYPNYKKCYRREGSTNLLVKNTELLLLSECPHRAYVLEVRSPSENISEYNNL